MQPIKYSKWHSVKNFFKRKQSINTGLEIDFGPRGCGKTTVIAKYLYNFLISKKLKYDHFYSNVEFKLINENVWYLDLNAHKLTDYLDPNDKLWKKYNVSTHYKNPTPFFIQSNSIICLDELGIIANCRNFKDFPKEFITFIKLLRKAGIYVIGNSQNYDIDLALKNGSNDLRITRKFLWWSVSRKIRKYPSIIRNNDESTVSAENIGDVIELTPIISRDAIRITFIPFYTDMFDSYV